MKCIGGQDLSIWAFYAKPGDRVIYYRGSLAKDGADGREALELAAGGTLLLCQKRHGRFNYEYIAIRSHQREVKRAPGYLQ